MISVKAIEIAGFAGLLWLAMANWNACTASSEVNHHEFEPTTEYTMSEDAVSLAPGMAGEFKFSGATASRFEVLTDAFAIASQPELLVQQLPAFNLQFVINKSVFLPVQRELLDSGHPYWNIMFSPGNAWRNSKPGKGDYWMVSLPFVLQEKNQNCLHNGLMRIRVNDELNQAHVSWQIGQETCQYLKFNATGTSGGVRFQNTEIENRLAVIKAHERQLSKQLPVKDITRLNEDYPGIELRPFEPPRPGHTTVYGLATASVHYRGRCPTRFGDDPYCDHVAVPSYSTAKSLFAGLGYLAMVKRYPDIVDKTVVDLVPECKLPDGRWENVRLSHLVNMTTGNYDSEEYHADESSDKMTDFFLGTSNAQKLQVACRAWPNRSEPGIKPVYHTTDDYLLGVALSRFLKDREGAQADLHRDILLGRVLQPVSPGPLLTQSLRTLDADEQPFVSHGLFYYPDDAARIGQYLLGDATDSDTFPDGAMDQVLFKDRGQMMEWGLSRGEGYALGFWGFDIAPYIECAHPVWIPFMSGYGGIIWALLPNQMVYYFFADGGHASWMNAVIEAHKISSICTN